MLSVRLPGNSRLLEVKFLGSHKLYADFSLHGGGLVPLTFTLFKRKLCISPISSVPLHPLFSEYSLNNNAQKYQNTRFEIKGLLAYITLSLVFYLQQFDHKSYNTYIIDYVSLIKDLAKQNIPLHILFIGFVFANFLRCDLIIFYKIT